MVLQGLADLAVEKLEQSRTALDECHAHAERAEHRSVLGADDAAAHDEHRRRQLLDVQDVVGGKNLAVVEGDVARACGRGADSDQDVAGTDRLGVLVRRADADDALAGDRAPASSQVDGVRRELLADDVDFGADDALARAHEFGERFGAIEREVAGVAGLGEGFARREVVDHRFAERLARDRARVDRHAADHVHLLDDADFLAEFGGLDGGFLAAGARADDDEVICLHGPGPFCGWPCGYWR